MTDGTACVGGNVFSFSQHFKHVNAIEFDKERYDMLVHNMRVLNTKNVQCWHGDYTTIHTDTEQELIFLDPPWGGTDYKKKKILPIKLGTIPIGLVRRLRIFQKNCLKEIYIFEKKD